MIDVRGQSANYFKNDKKPVQQDDYDYYEDPNLLKNKPDGNARRFSAIISPRDLLPNLDKSKYTMPDAIEEIDEDQKTEHSDGSENLSKASSATEQRSSHNSDSNSLNSSHSSISSLPKNDHTEMVSEARRTSDKYASLSDYWKEQAQRRRSRIGLQYGEDLQRLNQIKNQKYPKEGNGLTPRQRQLLSQASAADKNLDDSKFGSLPIRCIFP